MSIFQRGLRKLHIFIIYRPNIITVSGWFLNLTYFLITLYYTGFKGADYIPPWACYTSAVCYCVYMTLDNMDGKQARRTKSSSPLGLLVDHGTDACTTFFISLGLGSILYFDSIKWFTFLWMTIVIAFFMNTWEEYYTGELNLPIIHGVSEGTIIIAIVMSLSGLYGKAFWVQHMVLFGIDFGEYRYFYVFLGFLAGNFYGIVSIVNVCMKCKDRWVKALKDTAIYFIMIFSYLSIILFNNSTIVNKYPKFLILTYGFAFAKMMGILQLSHLLGAEFNAYQKTYTFSFLFNIIHSLVYYFTGVTIIASIDVFIIISFVINFLAWMHFGWFVSEEICDTLGINRFSLTKRSIKKD